MEKKPQLPKRRKKDRKKNVEGGVQKSNKTKRKSQINQKYVLEP